MSVNAGVTTEKAGMCSGTSEMMAKRSVVVNGTSRFGSPASRWNRSKRMAASPRHVGIDDDLGPFGGLGERHGALRQHPFEPEIDDAHELEARQLGVGLDPHDTALDRANDTDRNARREDTAGAARDDPLADFHRSVGAQVEETRLI